MKENDKYVIKDGILYHAGVKGMKWGKHLPGTDWWKETTGNTGSNALSKTQFSSLRKKQVSTVPRIKGAHASGSDTAGSYKEPVKPKPTSGRQRVSKSNSQAKDGGIKIGYNSFENQLARKVNGYESAKRRQPSSYIKDYHHEIHRVNEDGFGEHDEIVRVRDRNAGNRDTAYYKINKAKDDISKAWESGKKKAGEAWESGKKKAGEAWTSGKSKVGKAASKFWNKAKGYGADAISKFKDQAEKAYATTGKLVNTYFEKSSEKYSKSIINPPKGSDYVNHLSEYIDKEMQDAVKAYGDAQKSGTAGAILNSFIQTSQMNIVNGCARFLDSIGMDDEVASFLKKLKIKK